MMPKINIMKFVSMISGMKPARFCATKAGKASRLKGFATKAVHAGYSREHYHDRPVIAPIVNSTAFEYETVDFPKGAHGYSRISNPTRSIVEETIAALEDANYGLCYSSGLAAIFAVSYLLNPGDHMVCAEVVYGGTMKQMRKYGSQKGLEISFVHPPNPSNVKKLIKENTKMVYVESPVNPLLTVVDLKELSDMVKTYPGVILAVDSTFMTPYFQNPLKYGVDIVVHSLSKYMGGHGDVVMGAVATNREDLYLKLKDILTTVGLVPSPFDCFLVGRGLKTLHLRMKEHQNNAFAVARFLESHPLIEKVIYPGLQSHPQHELAKMQCQGFGGVVSFYIRGGRTEAETFLHSLELVTNTGSLGQPNSLICYPAAVSHFDMDEKARQRVGITDNFIRMSVGLETQEDIIDDLRQALDEVRNRK